jgi:hypothetical protein
VVVARLGSPSVTIAVIAAAGVVTAVPIALVWRRTYRSVTS